MIDEFSSSIRRVLSERIVSPLLGSLSLSWIAFNWQIFYFLLTTDDTLSSLAKIKYVEANLNNKTYLFWFPLSAAIGYTLFYPFVSLGVTYLWERVDSVKKKLLQTIRRNQLLTIEQSLALRQEIDNMEQKIQKALLSKDLEITRLQGIIESQDRKKVKLSQAKNKIIEQGQREQDQAFQHEYDAFKKTPYFKHFAPILHSAAQGYRMRGEGIDIDTVTYCISQGLISETDKPTIFRLTEKGKFFSNMFLAETPA